MSKIAELLVAQVLRSSPIYENSSNLATLVEYVVKDVSAITVICLIQNPRSSFGKRIAIFWSTEEYPALFDVNFEPFIITFTD